jgi:hypothetical protein
MDIDSVPQDKSRTYAGHNKLLYGVKDSGEYATKQSSGWEVEDTVTLLAVEELDRLAEEARLRVRSGLSSPLEYFMIRQRMDIVMLSQSTGFFKWRIRRHFRPHVFGCLKSPVLQRYCDALGVDERLLKEFNGN